MISTESPEHLVRRQARVRLSTLAVTGFAGLWTSLAAPWRLPREPVDHLRFVLRVLLAGASATVVAVVVFAVAAAGRPTLRSTKLATRWLIRRLIPLAELALSASVVLSATSAVAAGASPIRPTVVSTRTMPDKELGGQVPPEPSSRLGAQAPRPTLAGTVRRAGDASSGQRWPVLLDPPKHTQPAAPTVAEPPTPLITPTAPTAPTTTQTVAAAGNEATASTAFGANQASPSPLGPPVPRVTPARPPQALASVATDLSGPIELDDSGTASPESGATSTVAGERTAERVVRRGESFWSIAEAEVLRAQINPSEREVAHYWRALVNANRDRLVNPDVPDLLLVGTALRLPAVDRSDTPALAS